MDRDKLRGGKEQGAFKAPARGKDELTNVNGRGEMNGTHDALQYECENES